MKGRTWCITFQDAATKDGDVKIKYHVIDASGAPRVIEGTWEGYKKGDTPDKKANRFFQALSSPPYNALVAAQRAGNTVCFQLRDNAPYQDITGINVGDESGQNFHVFDDPPREQPNEEFLETVRFSLAGMPMSPKGEVRLGLGTVAPMARVATHSNSGPLSIPKIIDALVRAFNAVYKELGYTAQKQNDEVVIPKVPCKLGARGGSDDSGLTYWLSMLDPVIEQPSVQFDKLKIVSDNLRLLHARLDLAGIPKAIFADANLERIVQADNDVVFQAAPCVCKIAIVKPPPPRRVTIGMKSIDVTVRYTADCKGNGLTDCAIYIIVDKIDNLNGKRVDSRTTVVNVTPPATNKELLIKADTDMGFGKNDAARITAMLVCNECTPAVAGPNLLDVP